MVFAGKLDPASTAAAWLPIALPRGKEERRCVAVGVRVETPKCTLNIP